MREKLATLELDAEEIDGVTQLAAGAALDSSCPECVQDLTGAGQAFDEAFANRDYEAFIGWFYDANATGLGADGTIGLDRDTWGRILREYFEEETWTLTVTPIKTVVQGHDNGQVLEIVKFDSAQGSITFVHVTVWVRKHGDWRVVLQTEAGPVEDTEALLERARLEREAVAR